ncbi:YbgA family protein [Vibrio sp. WXL103]|uniref:YbgA family protein n=1 Tax=Vibrio sp. WXL103 TaxID=3450710 RepID=UPI003EC81EC6
MLATKAKVGISSCVLGEKVRFDSGHKISNFVTKELSSYLEFISVCPEVGIGLSVPRPTIRLISNDERIALVETKDETKDYTDLMIDFSNAQVDRLSRELLCGYIVCAKSPTCGMERVKVYKNKRADKEGVGMYTEILMQRMPWLPVEEDGRLNDPVLRENFISRIYSLQDLYHSMGDEVTRGKIVAFHSRYKLTLMAHHPDSYRSLGQLVANIKDYSTEEFFDKYRLEFMNAMKKRASRKNNTNVLMHIQGYFKRSLDKPQKAELAKVIDDYRTGMLPLLAPLTLIKHYLSTYPDDYLANQKYLEPYPQELRLRYGL